MKQKTIIVLMLLLFLSVIHIAGSPLNNDTLSAQEIMDRCADRTEFQYESLVEATFESEAFSKNQKLDGNGKITNTETLRYIQYPLNGAVFEELIEKNGRPLNEKELDKEESRKQDFIGEVEKRRTRGDYLQPKNERAIRFDRSFTARYQYELVKTEQIRTHDCWVIDFKPKEGKLPVQNTMDHALNQLTGTFWVSRDDFGLVRVVFAMRKPFKYWGGFLAVIRKTDGSVDYTRVEPDIWIPLHFNLELDIKIMLVKNIRQILTKDWYNYKRATTP